MDEISSEYRGRRLLIFTACFIPVQILCVALRYLARYLVEGPWGLDDIVVLTSLAFQLCLAGISIGVGYHIPYLEAADPKIVTIWGKYLVAISTLYFAGVNIPKLAILALYHRLFPNRSNRYIIYALMGILIGLTISTVVTALVACIPFAANWDPTLPGARCINKEAFFRWGSLPNIVTDVVMLVLPMRIVWNLHTTTSLKVGLTITFMFGSFGLITSIVRFTTFFQQNSFEDGTWSAVDLIIWTQIEGGVYLISACLMTYRPLLERVGRGRFFSRLAHSIISSRRLRSNNSRKNSADIPLAPHPASKSHGFQRLQPDIETDLGILVTTNVNMAKDCREGHQEGNVLNEP